MIYAILTIFVGILAAQLVLARLDLARQRRRVEHYIAILKNRDQRVQELNSKIFEVEGDLRRANKVIASAKELGHSITSL